MGKLRLRPKVDREELRRRVHAVLVDKYPCGEDFSERGARWLAVDAILDHILPLFAVDVGTAKMDPGKLAQMAAEAHGYTWHGLTTTGRDKWYKMVCTILRAAGFEMEEGTGDGS